MGPVYGNILVKIFVLFISLVDVMTKSYLAAPEYDALVSRIYRAALEPREWAEVMKAFSDLANGAKVHMFGHDLVAGMSLDIEAANYDPDYLDSFASYYSGINPWAPGYEVAPVGHIVTTAELYPREDFLKTEFYSDWILPQEDIADGAGTIMERDPYRLLVFGANLSHSRAEGELEPLRQLTEAAVGHFRQAFRLTRALASERIEAAAGRIAGLSPDPLVLVVTANRRIVYANTRAWAALDDGTVIQTDTFGRLHMAVPAFSASLNRAIQRLGQIGDDRAWTVRTQGNTGIGGLVLNLVRFEPDDVEHTAFGAIVGQDEPNLLVVLSGRDAATERAQRLRAAFDLTDAESEIALAFAEGETLADIAKLRRTSVSTVRNQFKMLRLKLGASTQADVVRILHLI